MNNFDTYKSFDEILENIKIRCQRDHWFGPDFDGPKRHKNISPTDPERFGFTFPPASEEILQATEAALGFPLPSLLRAIYACVANGGFGPGAGIPGTFQGYGNPEASIYSIGDDDTIVAQYRTWSRDHTIDLVESTKHNEEPQKRINLKLPYGVWPAQVIPLCDMGCVQKVCVHSDGRMFHFALIENNDIYWLYQMPWTFEEWLWRWVHGERLMIMYANE